MTIPARAYFSGDMSDFELPFLERELAHQTGEHLSVSPFGLFKLRGNIRSLLDAPNRALEQGSISGAGSKHVVGACFASLC